MLADARGLATAQNRPVSRAGPPSTSRRAWLAACAAAPLATRAAEALRLEAGGLLEFRVELPAALHRLAGPVRRACVQVAAPPAFDPARRWPLLVVSATSDPSHQSSRGLLAHYRAAASAAGWEALAADPEPEVAPAEDTLSLRFALVRAALAAVQTLWRDAATAALAFGGFSGGAKYAGSLAALFAQQGAAIAGVFLAGVNEEPLAGAARRLGVLDARFTATPVFLQAGRLDRIAPPQRHERLLAELREAGFTRLRLGLRDIEHEPDAGTLAEALAWFAQAP